MKKLATLICLVALCSCSQNNHQSFCTAKSPQDFSLSFQVTCPAVPSDNVLPSEYGPKSKGGMSLSPPISWTGLPTGTTHLYIEVMDGTCTYMCNDCCQFHHWVMMFPVDKFPNGLKSGIANTAEFKPYNLPNGIEKKEYFPFEPPTGWYHAYFYRVTAYEITGNTKTVTGRAQSKPMLFTVADSLKKITS